MFLETLRNFTADGYEGGQPATFKYSWDSSASSTKAISDDDELYLQSLEMEAQWLKPNFFSLMRSLAGTSILRRS